MTVNGQARPVEAGLGGALYASSRPKVRPPSAG
jgi:hypothetical protein